ncbi:MAG: hypothetical protein PVJ39_04555 [Gammaproteobacteria bacterium]|jgi:hypothetical protein
MAVVVVLGMHKSGTTLVAKTLHEAGINMGVSAGGDYPRFKYEDPRVLKIKSDILFGGKIVPSYTLPTSYADCSDQVREYVKQRNSENGDSWGFKVPGVTLCYSRFKQFLPKDHIAIGVKRDLDGVLAHYDRRRNRIDTEIIERAYMVYNGYLAFYGVPIIRFEDILEKGPVVIELVTGLRSLPDVRR